MSDQEKSNVQDLLKYRENKKIIQQLSQLDTSKLGMEELRTLTSSLSKMVVQLTGLLENMAENTARLAEGQANMQDQFVYVSGQAYVALTLLKERGVCTAVDISDCWKRTVEDKIKQPQEDAEHPPEVDDEAELDVSEADLEDLTDK